MVSAETENCETEVVRFLSAGQPVALPTETVYGLAADALNPMACERIFKAKERPFDDPLIVHLPSPDWLDKLCEPSPLARRLAEVFWPGPLTLVLPRHEIVPDIVTAHQNTLAVRISAHPIFQKIINAFNRPLAAPSANRFGRISPTQAAHVRSELDGRIPLIVDAGPCLHGIESTIVSIQSDHLLLCRQGPITKEQLERFAVVLEGGGREEITPGSLPSHYAPRTPCRFWEGGPPPVGLSVGLLAWNKPKVKFAQVEYLSTKQDLRDAAANLYDALRRLDEAMLDLIFVERVPTAGCGAAIMERLTKATGSLTHSSL
ncbi:MAG: threonylcarbamoyl-AMP synthase [Verrucomicrobia bacterium]|nr:MAG: threonylcarbamoyl-AMP synthase [Verrucomicrobiota bacterium]